MQVPTREYAAAGFSNEVGQVPFTYFGTGGEGVDMIRAQFRNLVGRLFFVDATKTWRAQEPGSTEPDLVASFSFVGNSIVFTAANFGQTPSERTHMFGTLFAFDEDKDCTLLTRVGTPSGGEMVPSLAFKASHDFAVAVPEVCQEHGILCDAVDVQVRKVPEETNTNNNRFELGTACRIPSEP